MICPTCHSPEHRVARTAGDRRQRQCERCGERWWTVEMPEAEAVRLRRIEKVAELLRDLQMLKEAV